MPVAGTVAAVDGTADHLGEARSAAIDLPLDALAARRARRMVADMLGAWHLDGSGLLDDTQLIVSELVTNAYLHGASGIGLEMRMDGGELEVAVRDGSAVVPRPRSAAPDAESGRGLAILAAITDNWGVNQEPGGGKRVWARLPAGEGI